jgi:monoamine oxidase
MCAEHTVDVPVVGAGLAGLVAARELRRQGVDVLVLEARDRVASARSTTHLAVRRLSRSAASGSAPARHGFSH